MSSEASQSKRSARMYLLIAFALLALAGGWIAADALSGSGGSKPPGDVFAVAAAPVPTNRVTGSGSATIELRHDSATVTLRTTGLLGGSPHLMHIHAKGLGSCPPASAARLHNGHLAISTADGLRYYGRPLSSLTVSGSTSGDVPTNIDMNLYPATGDIRYSRTLTVTPELANLIRRGDAVIVVHGIDYDRNHAYDFAALGVSDLDKTLPGEATAPALCGPLVPTSSTSAAIDDQDRNPPTTSYVASLTLDAAAEARQRPLPPAYFCHIG